MFAENGGGILWVEAALGPLAGWMNAYNSLLALLVDLPVYIVLGARWRIFVLRRCGGFDLCHKYILYLYLYLYLYFWGLT